MGKDGDKTTSFGDRDKPSSEEEDYGYSTTVEISRRTFVGEVHLKQRAYLEVVASGESSRVFELGEEEVVVGRSSECGIQVMVENVSRKHARIFFRNDEYHVEDLDSTNGTYVNGIRVVKCALRNNDHIEIGGVKILFNEEKSLKKT
jgi:pSer/pThr/pTyr-binding forkhead associated (FHA) protein